MGEIICDKCSKYVTNVVNSKIPHMWQIGKDQPHMSQIFTTYVTNVGNWYSNEKMWQICNVCHKCGKYA